MTSEPRKPSAMAPVPVGCGQMTSGPKKQRPMTTQPNSPPVHVHVDKATPVHVHLKSFKKPKPVTKPQANLAEAGATAEVKTRVRRTPPGRDSPQDTSFKWEGPRHCLEIIPPRMEPELSKSARRLSDLKLFKENKEEGLHEQISEYQKKIDTLMTEVSSLKDKLLERHSDQLNISLQALAQQEEELAKINKELEETAHENVRLRHSMGKMVEESKCTWHQDKDCLLRKLMEAEVDGAGSKQGSSQRESGSKPSAAGSRQCGSKSSAAARQEELLRQKLDASEETNRALRHLIREEHNSQVEMIQLLEQNDVLQKKLAHMETENARVVVKLQDKSREVEQLSELLDAQKDTARSSANISKSLESVRAHLQGQLRNKEAENNRLSVQMKNLKQASHQQRMEMDHLSAKLSRQKQLASADRDALKQATQAHKWQAEHNKDTVDQLRAQLLEVEKQLSEALSTAETWQSRFAQEGEDKRRLEAELMLINRHISELTKQLHVEEDKSRAERETLLDHLHRLNTENTAAKQENQKLKAASSEMEEKVAFSQLELQQVKASIKQYESLLDSYKVQIQKTRAEADEYCVQLAKAEQRAEVVRREFLGQLAELAPLSKAQHHSKVQLQEAQERERRQEEQSMELGETINNLQKKVENQGSQMEYVRKENKVLLEENQLLQQTVDSLERKLKETGCQNTELVDAVNKKEKMIHSNQLLLEEKTRESSLLNKKLDEALNDARQQMLDSKERAATKEHSTQAKILELETQLSRTTSEVNQLRRSKEEVTRRYQSQLQDVKDRLEQTDSTNRSLQNYVQFLKTSYATVFADVALSSSMMEPPPV